LTGGRGLYEVYWFALYLQPPDVEAIRAYVIHEAQREKQRLANP
jgi:hypothetical protein